jgi:hypothetical protein
LIVDYKPWLSEPSVTIKPKSKVKEGYNDVSETGREKSPDHRSECGDR